MTIEDIRSRFPFLSQQASGERPRIYLDHAATSPWSADVLAMIEDLRAERAFGSIEVHERTMTVVERTRAQAAWLTGADADDVAFVQNTSEALNILASGLPWRSGDRVALVDREFPTNIYPFLNLARLGVAVDLIPQTDGIVRLEDIERALTPRTVLLSISWVQFLSGFVADLKAIGDLCRANGTLLSVDAIQGLGGIRLDLRETPVDFLAAGTQKWQMGPQGLAIAVVPPATRDRITQAHLGWLSVEEAWNFFEYRVSLLPNARRYEGGTPNTIGVHMYHGALSFFEAVGLEEVDRLVRANASLAWELARDRGLDLITPADARQRAGIVTFRHARADELAAALHRQRMHVSARAGHIRISPHCYNTADEIHAVFEALDAAGV